MGWDKLMETLKKRFEEQKERHEGGNKMDRHRRHLARSAPTATTRRASASARTRARNKQRGEGLGPARSTRTTTTRVELGTRNIKVALRRLRRSRARAREEELDLDDTIRAHRAPTPASSTSRCVPERHNNVKVLLLMDVGGTMDEHIQRVEELFSAAKTEFKHLEFYLLPQLRLRLHVEEQPAPLLREVRAPGTCIRKYNKDYKLIFVGDATMSPYEILQPGGSVEYNNEEPGAEWLQRLTDAFPKFAWINPEPEGIWGYRQSIAHHPAADEPPHVPDDARGPRAGDEAAGKVSRSQTPRTSSARAAPALRPRSGERCAALRCGPQSAA